MIYLRELEQYCSEHLLVSGVVRSSTEAAWDVWVRDRHVDYTKKLLVTDGEMVTWMPEELGERLYKKLYAPITLDSPMGEVKVIPDPNHVGPPIMFDSVGFFNAMKPGLEKLPYHGITLDTFDPPQKPDEPEGDDVKFAGTPEALEFFEECIAKRNEEQTIDLAQHICRHYGHELVPAGNYKPFSYPDQKHPREHAFAHVRQQRREQEALARTRVLASLREWPRCHVTDTDLKLEWTKGLAYFVCTKCYQ